MRFRAPIEPLLVVLAAGAIWWLTGILHALPQGKSDNTTQHDGAHISTVSTGSNEKVIKP
jgi:hypothetical protein